MFFVKKQEHPSLRQQFDTPKFVTKWWDRVVTPRFNIDPAIYETAEEMTALRRELHRHPQTGFEETFAHEKIIELLKKWDLEYDVIAGTGIVITLNGNQNTSGKTIGFRADMDALDMEGGEKSGVEWKSIFPDKMHACGHDGHMASMLAALAYRKDRRDFDGTIKFLFQPAEEGIGGAEKMLEKGLLKKHTMDAIYGYHNWPWLPFGTAAIHSGPVMSANTRFYITIQGKGGHSGSPELANNPVDLMTDLKKDFRKIRQKFAKEFPGEKIIIEPTVMNVGNLNAPNVISGEGTVAGTIRTYSPEVIDNIDPLMTWSFQKAAAKRGMKAQTEYMYTSTPTINDREKAGISYQALSAVIGKRRIRLNEPPSMLSDDFGRFSSAKTRTSYIWLGNGNPGSPLHSNTYDYNDALIPLITQYVSNIVDAELPLTPPSSPEPGTLD